MSATLLGAKQRFNKERIQLVENVQSARCSPFVISKVLAARMRNLITARARKNKRTARMLANARKDHSIPFALLSRHAQRTKRKRSYSLAFCEVAGDSCYTLFGQNFIYADFAKLIYIFLIRKRQLLFLRAVGRIFASIGRRENLA